MKKDIEYRKLLEIILLIGEEAKGLRVGEDKRLLDAEGLARKFVGHATSIYMLSHGTRYRELPY